MTSTTSTILLLDDDRQFRELVRPVLQANGLIVIEATTGAEAKALLDKGSPDLVIVDGNLPDADGISWISSLRASGNQVKVVFVSSALRDQNSYHKLTAELNVLLVLHKPIVAKVFGEQIEAIVQGDIKQLNFDAVKSRVPNLASRLSELTDSYVAQLPSNIKELKFHTTASKNPLAVVSLAEAVNCAHKLSGTAGSYGLPHFGQIMKQAEERLRQLQEVAASDTPDRYDRLWRDCLQLVEVSQREALELSVDRNKNKSSDQAANAQQLAAASEDLFPVADGAIATPKLLVVDDDPAFLDLVVELGKPRLVEILPANTSAQALKIAEERHINGALLDVQLGEEDISFELAEQLRALPGYENLPLAFISGRAHIYNRVAASHAGACLYLNKPLNAADLDAAFMQLLSHQQFEIPRVLIVDDDEGFSSHLAGTLQHEGMEVATLNDPVRILDVLPEIVPDLLILDIMMPGVSGFDVCRMLRTALRWQNLPILFLTAQTSHESRLTTFEVEGDDCLIKSCPNDELIGRIKMRIKRARLQKEKAYKDSLTGLFSRRASLEQLERMFAAAQKLDFPVSICLFDIENFRAINETHGYLAGDHVIRSIALMLTRHFNPEDLRGRWGGDEFIVALHAVDYKEAQEAVAAVLREFHRLEFPSEEDGPFKVSLSAGIGTFPQDGTSAYDLIKTADRRLAAARQAGPGAAVGPV